VNREVNVTKRVKTLQGLRYCPVVLSANGRIRPDWVLVNGTEERHPEGAYYLEWREGTKRTRLSVGNDPATATARRMQKEAEFNAKNHGIEVAPAVLQNGNNGHRSLATAVAEFLEETKLTKKPEALAAYTTSLDYFTESCPKQYLEDIERRDLLKFAAFLRDEKEQAPRSCWNKFSNVMSFLKVNGIRGLVKKTDWPRYTEEEPEIYAGLVFLSDDQHLELVGCEPHRKFLPPDAHVLSDLGVFVAHVEPYCPRERDQRLDVCVTFLRDAGEIVAVPKS